MKIWRQAGKLLRNVAGKVLRCAVCPCTPSEPVPTGCCPDYDVPATLYATVTIAGITIPDIELTHTYAPFGSDGLTHQWDGSYVLCDALLSIKWFCRYDLGWWHIVEVKEISTDDTWFYDGKIAHTDDGTFTHYERTCEPLYYNITREAATGLDADGGCWIMDFGSDFTLTLVITE